MNQVIGVKLGLIGLSIGFGLVGRVIERGVFVYLGSHDGSEMIIVVRLFDVKEIIY